MAAGTIRDWEWKAVQKYLRTVGPKIRDMAASGDGIAIAVFAAYEKCWRTQAPDKSPDNLALRDALNDFFLRDVNIKDREAMANRFGVKLPGVLQ